jgi:hypothetical protein
LNRTTEAKSPRHFYLIGHRCNDISRINSAFRSKVNGIECDLWADKNKKWWISHDGMLRTELTKWLSYIKKADQTFDQQLSLIVFDVKTPLPITGVRDMINDYLPREIPRVYSTAKIEKAHIFKEIVNSLGPLEGISIDEEDDPHDVAKFFADIGATQCWYGNGISVVPLNDPFHESMQVAAPIRDSKGPFSKIYTWSVHRKEAIRKYIEEDKVDGIIVGLNNPFTRPVSYALEIIAANEAITLANRSSGMF